MAITKHLDEVEEAAIAAAAEDVLTAPPPSPKPVRKPTVFIEIKTFEVRVRKIWSWVRSFWWLFTTAFLVITLHLGMTLFEKESLLGQAQLFLQDRQEQVSILSQSLNKRKMEVRQLVNRLRAGEEELEFLRGSLQFLNQGFATDRKKAEILEELGRRVPKGIRLRELNIEENRVQILGYTANRALIDRFLRSLRRSPHFQDAQLLSVEAYETVRGLVTFEILC